MFAISNICPLFTSQVVTLFILNICVLASCESSEKDKTQKLSVSNEADEGGSVDEAELDSKISKTIETLTTLDATLAKNSNDPPIDGGDKMKEMVQKYNNACSDLLSLCKIDKLKVLDAASDMLEPGGPKFLDVEINKPEMKRNFKWNEDNITEFLDLTKKTYSCWKTLWSLYNNFP